MSDLDQCATLRASEWEVFQSIYPDSISSAPSTTPAGTRVQLELPVDLGSEHEVLLCSSQASSSQTFPNGDPSSLTTEAVVPIILRLSHLPPLLLTLILPPAYPLHEPPNITSIHSTNSWLPLEAQSRLQLLLEQMWEGGEGVLWRWAEWIREGEFLPDVGLKDSTIIRISHPAPALLAPLLEAYDVSAGSSLFSTTTYTCAVCLTPHKGSQCVALAGCGHVFCRTCLQDFWGLCIAEGDVGRVGCPDPDCTKKGFEAGEEDVRRVVGDEAVERWKWLREKKELEKDPTIVYCPLQVCQAPVPRPPQQEKEDGKENRWDAFRTCSHCGFSFCAYCRRVWHGVLTRCEFSKAQAFVLAYVKTSTGSAERRAIEQRYGRANVLRLVAQHEEDEQNRQWLQESTMPCPGCNVSVEKSFGCNHMTCARCKMHFCYRCGVRVNPLDPYRHFNDPHNKCMLFDTKELEEPREWQPVEAFDALGQF